LGQTAGSGRPSVGSLEAPVETAVRPRPFALLALVALFATLLAVPPAVAAADRTADEAAAESTMFDEHNVARSDPGAFGHPDETPVGGLEWAEDVAEVARAWSDEMAATGIFKHNPDFSSETCCWTRVGENIAWVQPVSWWGSPEGAAKQTFQNLMDSDGHRNNIMNGHFDQVGVGVTIDGNDRMWTTVVFRQLRVDPGRVAGTVTTGSGPASFAFVDVGRDGQQVTKVATHTDGTYVVPDLEPGSYELTVTYSSKHEAAHAVVTVVSNETTARNFELVLIDPGGSVPDEPKDDDTTDDGAKDEPKDDGTKDDGTKDEPDPSFSDVPKSHTFYADIMWMATSGVTTGYPDGTFKPGRDVNRGQMAAFMFRLAGSPKDAFPNPGFSDVPTSHQFYREIAWMAQSGVTAGYNDGTFRPGGTVNRGQMAAFMHRYAGSPGATKATSFTDVPKSHPFHGDISWMAQSGVTTGYNDGTFRPANNVNRGQMAAFMHRFEKG
jgi:uncharacterized protein YkwD